MSLNEKIEKTSKKIDTILEEEVRVYFINVIDNNLLMKDDNLPSLIMKKKELTEPIIKERLEYLMGTKVKNIRSAIVNSDDRYYLFDFVTNNVLSSYDYIKISDLSNVDLLKMIKDVLD